MKKLFYVILILIPFGRLVSASLFESATKMASLTPDEVVLGILVLAFVFKNSRFVWSSRSAIGTTKPILFFVAWSFVCLIVGKFRFGLTASETVFSGLYLIRWVSYCALFYIAYDLTKTGAELKRIFRWLVVGSVMFAGFGLIQAAFLPDFAFILHPSAVPYVDFDPQGHRLVSTFLDPNIAAGYILIFSLISLSFWIHGYTKWMTASLFFAGALFVTLSRGGISAFFLGIMFLVGTNKWLWKKAVWGLLGIAAIVLLMYPVLSSQIQDAQRIEISDPSALSRIRDWATAIEIVGSSPWTGIGFNTLGFVAPQFGYLRESANAFSIAGDLITICVLTGFIGLCVYLWIYVDVIRGLSRLSRSSGNTWVRAYSRGLQAATIAVVLCSFFTTLLLYPEIMAVLWILWALGIRLEQGVSAQLKQNPTLSYVST